MNFGSESRSSNAAASKAAYRAELEAQMAAREEAKRQERRARLEPARDFSRIANPIAGSGPPQQPQIAIPSEEKFNFGYGGVPREPIGAALAAQHAREVDALMGGRYAPQYDNGMGMQGEFDIFAQPLGAPRGQQAPLYGRRAVGLNGSPTNGGGLDAFSPPPNYPSYQAYPQNNYPAAAAPYPNYPPSVPSYPPPPQNPSYGIASRHAAPEPESSGLNFPGSDDIQKKKKAQQEAYREELKRQMIENEEKKKKVIAEKKAQQEKEYNELLANNQFSKGNGGGAGGGGAPLRDANGNIIASRRPIKSQQDENQAEMSAAAAIAQAEAAAQAAKAAKFAAKRGLPPPSAGGFGGGQPISQQSDRYPANNSSDSRHRGDSGPPPGAGDDFHRNFSYKDKASVQQQRNDYQAFLAQQIEDKKRKKMEEEARERALEAAQEERIRKQQQELKRQYEMETGKAPEPEQMPNAVNQEQPKLDRPRSRVRSGSRRSGGQQQQQAQAQPAQGGSPVSYKYAGGDSSPTRHRSARARSGYRRSANDGPDEAAEMMAEMDRIAAEHALLNERLAGIQRQAAHQSQLPETLDLTNIPDGLSLAPQTDDFVEDRERAIQLARQAEAALLAQQELIRQQVEISRGYLRPQYNPSLLTGLPPSARPPATGSFFPPPTAGSYPSTSRPTTTDSLAGVDDDALNAFNAMKRRERPFASVASMPTPALPGLAGPTMDPSFEFNQRGRSGNRYGSASEVEQSLQGTSKFLFASDFGAQDSNGRPIFTPRPLASRGGDRERAFRGAMAALRESQEKEEMSPINQHIRKREEPQVASIEQLQTPREAAPAAPADAAPEPASAPAPAEPAPAPAAAPSHDDIPVGGKSQNPPAASVVSPKNQAAPDISNLQFSLQSMKLQEKSPPVPPLPLPNRDFQPPDPVPSASPRLDSVVTNDSARFSDMDDVSSRFAPSKIDPHWEGLTDRDRKIGTSHGGIGTINEVSRPTSSELNNRILNDFIGRKYSLTQSFKAPKDGNANANAGNASEFPIEYAEQSGEALYDDEKKH